MVDFLRDNWQYISFALVFLVNLFILIFKRNKIVVSDVYQILVNLINDAERFPVLENGFNFSLSGKEKLCYVLDHFYKEFPEYRFIPRWQVSCWIEEILSTPTKKGGCGREEA